MSRMVFSSQPGTGLVKAKHKKPRRLSQETLAGTQGHGSGINEAGATRENQDIPHTQIFIDNRLPWLYFKQDVLRIIHSLRIPRWKRWINMDMAADLQVTRISGALTNAIYAIEPPVYTKEMVQRAYVNTPHLQSKKSYHSWMPAKLLLRVYGAQVDYLIDRDTELAVLRRLALKDIGPRLLGTFINGRFEQFLNAEALTKEDLRDKETSIQIAKRMRELHDNIALLPSERIKGPMVWVNYDKWMIRAVEVLKQMEAKTPGATKQVLESDLKTFLSMASKYRKWLFDEYNGETRIKEELVFAHNDTQYGNILRFMPPKGSPLLAPQNEHRQLVVIDFEYSAANVRGFDIANHFCEWMNDYHDETQPHHVWEDRYPTEQQQLAHIQGYVEHGFDTFEDEEKMEKEVGDIMKQVRDWRPAVHLYWCVWGVVQAVVDESTENEERKKLDEKEGYRFLSSSDDENGTANTVANEDEEVEDAPEFNYVAYATEKVRLFWSDMIKFGFMTASDYQGQGPIKYIKE